MPDAEPAGFLALALGKHGAQELNYSSDIDVSLFWDPDRVAGALAELRTTCAFFKVLGAYPVDPR